MDLDLDKNEFFPEITCFEKEIYKKITYKVWNFKNNLLFCMTFFRFEPFIRKALCPTTKKTG